MCGRFTLILDYGTLLSRFHFVDEGVQLTPRYNMAPGQDGAVVVQDEERYLRFMRWGLVPSWAKDPATGYRMINARAETVHEKPSYRKPFRSQRCLVLADSFFEWKKTAKGKIPLRIQVNGGEPFAMAGLWDVWQDPKGKPLFSFTVVTTPANSELKSIHDRMPAILDGKREEAWLDPSYGDPLSLLKPYSSKGVSYYQVSDHVNSWKHEDARCIEPVSSS